MKFTKGTLFLLGRLRPAAAFPVAAGFLLLSSFVALGQERGSLKDQPWSVVEETSINLGDVEIGTTLRRTLPIRNQGTAALIIRSAKSEVEGLTVHAPSLVPPGAADNITIEFEAGQTARSFDGEIRLETNEEAIPVIVLRILGRVTEPTGAFEILPRRVIALSSYRSEAGTRNRSVTLVNKGQAPLEVIRTEGPKDRVNLKLLELEKGQRYRLTVALRPDSRPGRQEDTITVQTNKGQAEILLLTLLKNEVYVSHEDLAFGMIDTKQLATEPDFQKYVPQLFHVYRRGSEPFEIQLESSLPFLQITREPADGPGALVDIPREGPTSVFDITVTPILDKLQPGPFSGEIRIKTNDERFPELTIPVKGEVR